MLQIKKNQSLTSEIHALSYLFSHSGFIECLLYNKTQLNFGGDTMMNMMQSGKSDDNFEGKGSVMCKFMRGADLLERSDEASWMRWPWAFSLKGRGDWE